MSRLYLGTCVYVHVPTINEKRGHGSERARKGGGTWGGLEGRNGRRK